MTPRQEWFKKRVRECIIEAQRLDELQDWGKLKSELHLLACELLYVTTEWDKYYREINNDKRN